MSNVIFPKYKQTLLEGGVDAHLNGSGTDGVYAALIDTALYTYSSSHQYYSDVEAGIVGTPKEITNKTFTNGLLTGDNLNFPNVTSTSIEAIVIFRKNTAANTTWRLVGYIDTASSGLPTTSITSSEVQVVWNSSGILQL